MLDVRRLQIALAVGGGLALGTVAVAQPVSPEDHARCASMFGGNPTVARNDPQPTEAEVRRRLREARCLQGSVDGDAAYAKPLEQIYEQLLRAAGGPAGAPGPR